MATKRTHFSRRDFLRMTAVGAGTLAGGRLLTACGPQPAAATATPVPPTATSVVTSTATSLPATSLPATSTPVSKPDIIKFYPTVPSKVVQTHHAGVWSDKTLVPGVLRQMLDASITKLTGLNDARSAWAALFRPGERIAIKVNAFSNSIIWTHVPLVTEVTNSLQEAGIPAKNITIYDYRTVELTRAGFTVNVDGPGVRCTGIDGNIEKDETKVMSKKINLGSVLKNCDALINMPVLKSHMLSGISFAMKNHFGSIFYPDLLHSYDMKEIAALNALVEIKDRTRLIIGDALAANLRYANSFPYWREDWIGDSIFMSFDPVAHDTMGLKLLVSELEKDGGNGASLIGMSTPSMGYANELGLGTRHEENIEFIEQKLA
jgi:uncharacterized protein (DUF362 family)